MTKHPDELDPYDMEANRNPLLEGLDQEHLDAMRETWRKFPMAQFTPFQRVVVNPRPRLVPRFLWRRLVGLVVTLEIRKP